MPRDLMSAKQEPAKKTPLKKKLADLAKGMGQSLGNALGQLLMGRR